MTSRKTVLKEIGRLVIESPPLRTSGGPSRYCADPSGRDILATPEEIAAARCADCKKHTILAARRAIDAGAKRVDVAMTVTDEPDEHVFMIVWWKDVNDDGEFRDPAREAGMPCRIIDQFIPVTVWPLSDFGKSSPVSVTTLDRIRAAHTQDAQESLMTHTNERQASGTGNAGGTDEMALALHDAFGSPFTLPHREPYFPAGEERRAQGPADTLANLGLIDAWSQNAQTQWNIDARAQGPQALHEEVMGPALRSPVASSPATPARSNVPATPAPTAVVPTPRPMMGASVPSAPAMTPRPVSPAPTGGAWTPKSVPTTPTNPNLPASATIGHSFTGLVHPSESAPHNVSPIEPSAHEPSAHEPTSHEPASHEPSPHASHDGSPSETHGASAVPHTTPVGHPAYGGQPGQKWQPAQPPVEGVTRNGGRQEWRGGSWVAVQPGSWREGQLRTAPDGTQLIFRKGDWVRGDEPSHVVVFSDGSYRVYCLDGRWHEGQHGVAYPQGYPIFHDVATEPLGSRFGFFISGTRAYRVDNVTGQRFFLGQYLPDGNVLVGWVIYHPRPDGTLVWAGPSAYGINPQADSNLIAYQPTVQVRQEVFSTPRVHEELDVFHGLHAHDDHEYPIHEIVHEERREY